MSEQKYTPEPWELLDRHIYSNNILIADISSVGSYHEQDIANAKRIVECVNALAGIENPAEWVQWQKNIALANAQLQSENEALQQMRQDYARVTADLIIAKNENERLKAELTKLKQQPIERNPEYGC